MKESTKNRLVRFFGHLLAPLGLYVYGYPMAGNTATVVVFFDGGKSVLVIKRKHNPGKGKYAFPGGFLEVGQETLLACAVRELGEESCIKSLRAPAFKLCDERSDPERDPRGVIIDLGYYVVVPENLREQVIGEIVANDDAEGAEVMSVETVRKTGLAFDHDLLLQHALEAAGFAA